MDDHSRKNSNSSESSNSDGVPQGETPDAVGGKTQTRRRFLKAGLVSVPMIVTLRGRPAHAQVSLGSVGNIFYGNYEAFLQNRGDGPGADNLKNRWAPADQNGFEMVDPTRRTTQDVWSVDGVRMTPAQAAEAAAAESSSGAPQLDNWSPDQPQLDNWSPD